MKLKTIRALLGGMRGVMAARMMRLAVGYFQVDFLSAAFSNGVLAMLAEAPKSLEQIAAKMTPDPAHRDAVRAWLDLGVGAKVLRYSNGKYALRAGLPRFLADPRNDAWAAFVQELAEMDGPAVALLPQRLRAGRLLTLADGNGEIVARSSRTLEPLVCEAIDSIVPKRGAFRLLDVGCGSGTYMRYAASRNPDLTATGIELQPRVALLARDNLRKWGIEGRAAVESGDIRERTPSADFDAAMLNNNIYYFPVTQRVDLMRHLFAFVKPGGCLLITTACLARNVFSGLLDIWSAGCEGCGRLPTPGELLGQMREAGFSESRQMPLIPLGPAYAFVARR